MNKYVFIADHFQIIGGAEASDDILRSFLGGECIQIRSADCTIQKLDALKQYRAIISNFTGLSIECRDYITKNLQYIIYEHDHKYLKSRDPSIYKNFIAPDNQIINYEFYRNAKTVVCQTDKHAEVVKKNLNLENIVSFGGSLWNNDQLDYLEQIGKIVGKTECYAILDSHIIHKNTRKAVEWCIKNNKPYKLLGLQDWKDFIRELSNCTHLCFFPGVLETCSRMAVEARMLGLTVVGNNLISALYEPWFKQYKDLELINYFREKNKNISQFIEDCFKQTWVANIIDKPKDITTEYTVILNLYKRPANLQMQVDAFKNQSNPPSQIWVWQNCSNDEGIPLKDEAYRAALTVKGIDRWITSNHNWKYTGRFAMAQLATTPIICISDDDSIPGKDWMKNCISILQKDNVLLGGVGVILNKDVTYSSPHERVGWPHPEIKEIKDADLVGHSWVFKKEILKHFWLEEPFTWETGEDIHFSAMLQKAGIKTKVPAQIKKDDSSSILGYELGIDSVASSHVNNHKSFYALRDSAVKHYINNGWKILNGK